MNGLGYADNRILATTHGFIEDSKAAEKQYKDEYKDYWSEIFDGVSDFKVVDDENFIETPVDYEDR
jgi:hypothetical protein